MDDMDIELKAVTCYFDMLAIQKSPEYDKQKSTTR